MSLFQLEATDGSGCTPVPEGETVIGRGPFLGIADKRVSRCHALLEVVDDKLRIKPVHVNPCFHQPTDQNKFVPLERNEWHWLHSGETLSLLPDKYAFKVIATHSEAENTLSNSQILDEECASSDDLPHTSDTAGTKSALEEPSCSVRDTSKEARLQLTQKSHAEKDKMDPDGPSPSADCKNSVEQARSDPRKRVLPDWMLQVDLKIQSLSSPVSKAGSNSKRRIGREKNMDKTNVEENLSGRKRLRSQEITDDIEQGSVKKKNSTFILQPEVSPGTSFGSVLGKSRVDNSSDNNHRKENVLQDNDMDLQNGEQDTELPLPNDGSQRGGSECRQNNSQPGSPSVKHSKPSQSEVPREMDDDDISLSPAAEASCEGAQSLQGSQQTTRKRIPCMYGESCYRKNPAHLQEFSHPGDSDYRDVESASQDDSDDRPECPYGTDCYRKNPMHKLQYQHTKPPDRIDVLDHCTGVDIWHQNRGNDCHIGNN
ncbi:hypothetical protein FKM82_010401 [Ascaphus truei]